MKPFESQSIYGAWLQAAEHLLGIDEDSDYNLILDIQAPLGFSESDKKIRDIVDSFLIRHKEQPLDTVADTIFPLGLYQRFGTEGVFSKYPEIVYPKILKKKGNDWGRYAHRLVRIQTEDRGKSILMDKDTGRPVNPLEKLVAKLSNYKRDPKRAAYEANLIDPVQDIPIYRPSQDRCLMMGGPCLSHLSFKVTNDKTLALTAFYRNHDYVERTLGNLLGLSWLLYFVSKETDIPAGGLTCISSMAQLEKGSWRQAELKGMIEQCRVEWDANSAEEVVEWSKVSVAIKT